MMAGAGSCTLCAAAAIRANEAADESLDNFQRFYYRHIAGSKDEVGRHRHQYTGVLDRHHTRLLEVKPGRQDEPIRCCLREISIEQPPKYTALSYTWGTNVRKKTVEVDGADFLVRNPTHGWWKSLSEAGLGQSVPRALAHPQSRGDPLLVDRRHLYQSSRHPRA